VEFLATAAYAYVNRDRATAGLRGQLREIVASAGAGVPDWSPLTVAGPVEVPGRHDRSWFVWTGRVDARISPVEADGRGECAAPLPTAQARVGRGR